MWNPRWWPRNGCDNRLTVKILMTTIQVSLWHILLGFSTKCTWIVVTKIFAVSLHAYYHNHFLATILNFTSFSHFTTALCGLHSFFSSGLDFIYMYKIFLFLKTVKCYWMQVWATNVAELCSGPFRTDNWAESHL